MRPLVTPALFLLALLVALPAAAQTRDGALPRLSPSATLAQTIGVTDVTITYGRPAVRGRTIFGGEGALVPFGEVWRTGADEATTITFSTPVTVEGQPLAAGTYGLFTVPGESAWTLVFNRVAEQWGAYTYDEGQDALRVALTPARALMAERFTITADDVSVDAAVFALHWADVRVPFHVGTDTDANLRAAAAAATAGSTDWRVPQRYAAWAAQNERMVADGAAWAEQAVGLEANYSTLATQARLAALQERWPQAVDAGLRAVEAARTMAEAPQDLARFEAQVQSWRARAGG